MTTLKFLEKPESFSARRLTKELLAKKWKIRILDDFLRKLQTTSSIERTVMIDFKMCCLYVVLFYRVVWRHS